TMVMTSPKIAVHAFRADPATTAPTTTASATPRRAGFTASGSWRGGQLRVGRRREDPECIERPVAQPRATDDLRHRDGSEGPRILGIGAVVAHQEQVTFGDHPLALVALDGRRLRRTGLWVGVQIRLLHLRVCCIKVSVRGGVAWG